ncbi:protein spt2-like [Vigna umbellata]|uniref:protein spt2-like n=1 Tax=Vigna umbellata TaxID=87088 RepID=UPI001F5E7228|nr:protein spt2-like [Vigna umbellata]XP_047150019.1 protein spt2-like [Vigna umbellata]
MRGYDNERDDYDDYYEDEEQEEYEEEGEEEYEEEDEEPRKPSKEEMEYLELRKKLKESIRKQMKKEGSGSSASRLDATDRRKNKLPYDNYGSFFGPSQPVIAQRVIQESKSLLENQHLASKVPNPHHAKKSQNKAPSGGSKSSSHHPPPKVSEVQVKAQKLKNTRDYSFLLSDDTESPAPSKAPPPHNMHIRNSEGRPAQVPARSKLPPISNGSKHARASHEERNLGSVAGRLPPKSGSVYKTSSTSKPSMVSADSRKQLGNNSGNGPGRPVGSNGMSSKMSVGNPGNKSSTPGVKNPVNGMSKSLPLKPHPPVSRQSMEQRIPRQNVEHRIPRQGLEQRIPRHSMEQRIPRQSMEQRLPRQSMEQRIPRPSNEQRIPRQSMDQRNPRQSVDQRNPRPSVDQRNPRQSMEQRKDIRELNRPKMIPKQPVASSKPQISRPLKHNSTHTASQDHRPKPKVGRRPFDEEEDEMDISNMIRSMFNYNPKKFVDDDDDDDMEAGFDEIMREERRSALIARREDEEQLRLIEEEEERERRRRMAKLKKRKFGE